MADARLDPPKTPARLGPYELQAVLGEGGMGIVYRAEHAHTGDRVAVKTVRVPHERQLQSIRREIYALGRIRHPGVVRILDEGMHEGVPWYAMELLEGETLLDYQKRLWGSRAHAYPDELDTRPDVSSASPSPSLSTPGAGAAPQGRNPAAAGQLDDVLLVVQRLCASLAFLHAEGIVHRDLKTANVFIRHGGAPVLIDFGLVWQFPTTTGREVLDVTSGAAGTVGYMAPEQIVGDLVDARTDLYAVGCILYEAVTGRLPFREKALVRKLSRRPIPPSHLVEGVPSALDELVLRLLEKRPRDRIGHADDVVRAIDALLAAEPVPLSSPARAYVYRPELVGRDDVLTELAQDLEAAEQGKGGCVLLRGESGIGKTYLAMAIARTAAARGLQVVAAACVPLGAAREHGGANEAPLHPFARVLEAIGDRCLEQGAEKTDKLLGPRGKVLAAIVPRLASLPGQERYSTPPEISAQAARERLLGALRETLGVYAAEWPVLLVIDDLQWADELSLSFLASLTPEYFQRYPVFVLATCRHEEAGEELAALAARSGVKTLDLGPLDAPTVAAIATDMLGLDEPPVTLVRELTKRAEGNPFFVGEYLRAAVEGGHVRRDAGGRWRMSEGAELPLPSTLRDLVRRRIERLTASARAAADAAAVIGRELDAELLAAVLSTSLDELRGALGELLARQILEEPEPGRLRFLHDKLRDFTYESLDASRRAALHAAVATAIEAHAIRTGTLVVCSPRLAYHFREAGNAPKAIDYLERAGEQALSRFANHDALRFFEDALALDAATNPAPESAETRLRRARWERRMADASWAVGDLDVVVEHANRALAWLRHPQPTSVAGWIASMAWNASEQLLHRVVPRAFVHRDETRRERAREAAFAAQRLSARYYFSFNAIPLVVSSLKAVNLAERAGVGVSAATAYGMLGMTVGIGKLRGVAARYGELARGDAERTGDRAGLISSLYTQAAWRMGEGAWDTVRALCLEGLALGEEGGASPDPQDVGILQTLLAHVAFYTGHFDESRRMYDELAATARARGNAQHLAWGLYASARALVPMGRLDEARVMLEEAHGLLESQTDFPSSIICEGLLGYVCLALGDADRARALADRALARIKRTVPSVFSTVAGYAAVTETYLGLWERALAEGDGPSARGAASQAASALRALRLFALSIPIGKPYARLMLGEARRLEGQSRGATRALRRAVVTAEALAMPYEEARARFALARVLPHDDAERATHLERAEATFSRMGCIVDAARVRNVIS